MSPVLYRVLIAALMIPAAVSLPACKTRRKPPISKSVEHQLERYLFSRSEVERIRQIVEPLRRSPSAEIEGTTRGYPDLKLALFKFTNQLMNMTRLKPGRRFRVYILDDDSLNAFVDGDEKIVVNSGSLRHLEPESLIATLCHEIAHSARNHVAKFNAFETSLASRKMNAVNREIRDYLDLYYDQDEGIYEHQTELYLPILKRWKAASIDLSVYRKRQESEADIVGAFLCAHAGMPPDTYIKGLRQMFIQSDRKGMRGVAFQAHNLHDGEVLEIPPEYILDDLFPFDTHPDVQERIAQLERVRHIIADHFDASEQLYSRWKRQHLKIMSLYRKLEDGIMVSPRRENLRRGPQSRELIPWERRRCRHGVHNWR